MDTLQDAYKDSSEDIEETQTPNSSNPTQIEQESTLTEPQHEPIPKHPSSDPEPGTPNSTSIPTSEPEPDRIPEPIPDPMAMDSPDIATTAAEQETEAGGVNVEPLGSEDVSSGSISEDEQNPETVDNSDKKLLDNEEDPEEEGPHKKHKSLFDVGTGAEFPVPKKKSSKKKSKGNNVWTKSTSRKGKKKAKNSNMNNNNNDITPKPVDTVFVAPVPRFPDRNDDSPDAKICLSKVYKAEKVELSDDRLSAGSCKGYRMVRATRGVSEGAWYFEVKLVSLGESGHTRLGWSTEKGDLQAPVGYDGNSFGYRDIDGSKIHKALRQKYGEEGYNEGDVIGFYINLPDGDSCAPKPPHLVWYKGQKYVCAPDPKEDPPKIIPGSEMSFFKNGLCQGVAFKDLYGGRYYPAASMYTLPNQPNCMVKFNFGPDFDCYPVDFGERPIPKAMIEVPYLGFDNRVENGVE